MDKMLVTVFTEEIKAYEATDALREMHAHGGVTIYSIAIVAQDRQGKALLKRIPGEDASDPAFSVATSGLVSLLGAQQRIAAKIAAGTLSDILMDYRNIGVGIDFVDQVSKHMARGRIAIVAEIDEDWAFPVDARMQALGGTVLRSARVEADDAELEREIIMLRTDIAGLKSASTSAPRDRKELISARIEFAQSELQALQCRALARESELRREVEAKLRCMMIQALRAPGEARTRLQQRIAELEARYKAYSAQLHKVEHLAEAALTS